jgi:hypothetical protein
VSSANTSDSAAPAAPRRPRRKRHLILWILLAIVVASIFWVLLSPNPFAQVFREFGGEKSDQIVLEKSFSVSPHSFRYYRFTVPDGSKAVSLVGQFTASVETSKVGAGQPPTHDPMQAADDGIELVILTQAEFATWQTGARANSVYNSGPVSQGKVHADLPRSAADYYAVFSNRFPAANLKNVNATLHLRFHSWVPDWIRHLHGGNLVWAASHNPFLR